jgi:pantoate--beta-alanine ligase
MLPNNPRVCVFFFLFPLVSLAKKQCDTVLATIFVNPSQFAPHEDFTKYPRTIDKDISLLKSVGCDALFMPSTHEMYPKGEPSASEHQQGTFVEVKGLSHMLEGQIRPYFFRGVATIVTKLLNISSPSKLFLGQKDAQQCVVVRNMLKDLCFPIDLVVGATVRETDGLAMSSRNRYLSNEERMKANILYRGLSIGQQLFEMNHVRDRQKLLSMADQMIRSQPTVELQYLSLVDSETFEEIETITEKGAIFSGSIKLGSTRLLDNVLLGCDGL